jgi:benzylsuccinate CoA-transferase BbsF subunit
MTSSVLSGVRVIDFCWVGAGALVTQALAVEGAEVIKIESSVHPDNLRLSGPFREGARNLDGSGYFASRNSGKKSFALNMSHPRSREIATRLVASGSVVTSNFRPGIMERWGLDYESVKAFNQSVIYLSMPMQGATGPHRDYVGFGSTIAAAAGIVEASGLPNRPPVGTGTHYPDHVPNPGHALVAVLAALWRRERTGRGAEIELAQLESTVNVIGPALIATSLGATLGRPANRVACAAPHGVFKCEGEDRWCAISVYDHSQWESLVSVIGISELARDPRFATLGSRKENEDALEVALTKGTIRYDAWDLAKALQDRGVAAAVVETPGDLFTDPNLVARDFWRTLDHAVLGEYTVGSMPFGWRGADRGPTAPAPLLGQHTDEIARTILQMSPEEIEAAKTAGLFL